MDKIKALATGRKGEAIAKKYLEEKGYKIIEQNYKTKYSEIDLVARQKNELVFVEVRTKIGENFGSPEETIDRKKLRKLWNNATAYAARTKWKGSCRIDAVCIVLKDYSIAHSDISGILPAMASGKFNIPAAIERLNHYENII